MTTIVRTSGLVKRYPGTLAEFPDGHYVTAWRDALDPHLVDLLNRV